MPAADLGVADIKKNEAYEEEQEAKHDA